MMELKSMEHQNWEGMYPNLFPRKFQKLNFIYRFVIGRPLDNKARTDCTFWHPATKGYPSRWLRFPGYVRALVRLISVYLLLLSATLLLAYWAGWRRWAWEVAVSHLSLAALLSLSVLSLRLLGRRGLSLPLPVWESGEERESGQGELSLRWVRVLEGEEKWRREREIPLARALGPLLQIEHTKLRPHEVGRWISIPRDYVSPAGKPVVIHLPAHFSGADEKHKSRIERAAANKLGMAEMRAVWQLEGEFSRLLLSAPELPPGKVRMRDILSHLAESGEYRPLLGMITENTALRAEMIEQSPHILLSAGPGAGKSALIKVIVMQALHWGWGVIVCDWKMTKELQWLNGMSGVLYITDIEAIHDMGERLGEEVEIRKKNGLDGRAKVLVVRDEWNVTASMLQEYWIKYRSMLEPEERRITPTKSPGLQGFAKMDFGGREFGLHDLLAAQKASNRIFNFNTDMRDCFNIRCIARYSAEAKRMLVGDMKPFPKKSSHPGRWTIVSGEEVAVVQVPWIENEEAREYALAGAPNPTHPLTSSHYPTTGVAGATGQPLRTTQGKELTHGVAGVTESSESLPVLDGEEVPAEKLMKLKDIADSLEYMGITLKMLQHASNRPGGHFPRVKGGNQFRGYEYSLPEVKEWAIKRQAARQTKKERP